MKLLVKLSGDDIALLVDSLKEEFYTNTVLGQMSYNGLSMDIQYNYVDLNVRISHVDYNGEDVDILNEADFLLELQAELYGRKEQLRKLTQQQVDKLVNNLNKVEFSDSYQFATFTDNISVSFSIPKWDSQMTVYDYSIYVNGTLIDEFITWDDVLYKQLEDKAKSML